MRKREAEIEWRLRTIHPNPGPHKRDKTEEGRRRKEKRAAKQEKKHLTIIAWGHSIKEGQRIMVWRK